jgi:tRNA dimethylallyltransferase
MATRRTDPRKKTLIVIAGPTASGKTNISTSIAAKLETEIISADSRQFYRELNIGVARPSQEELKQVRHHFIANLSIHDKYDIGQYESDVLKTLSGLFKTHQVVIMTGGSGLYIKAVCQGMDDLPAATDGLRREIQSEYQAKGLDYLRDRLKTLDPEYFNEVDLQNPQRLIRAIEVTLSAGIPYSRLRKGTVKERDFQILKFGVDIPRAELHQRINTRVDRMVLDGLVEEARGLVEFRRLNALNTVGYKELFRVFDHEITLDVAVEMIKSDTRRYAKRQLTWFRKDTDITWLTPDRIIEEIFRIIEK